MRKVIGQVVLAVTFGPMLALFLADLLISGLAGVVKGEEDSWAFNALTWWIDLWS